MTLAFSQSCENNKHPILEVLADAFRHSHHVLEIGSGTGQHAAYFARQLPHLIWQTSDQAEYLDDIRARLASEPSPNLKLPLCLDVSRPWPLPSEPAIDGLFSANTAHIMSEQMVEALFDGIGRHLAPGGQLCLYGPFNYQGQYSSASNAEFDRFLKRRDPQSGIRDFEWICKLAAAQGLRLAGDIAMPANNRLLHFCLPESA